MILQRGLYGMADASWGDPEIQARVLAEEGVEIVQLRCKGWSSEALLALGERCLRLGPQIVINDDLEVARKLGTAVHLGQQDGEDPELPFGRSTHSLEDVVRPGTATYLGFGPVFASTTKAGVRTPRGVEMLAQAVRLSRIPVVAIGGIDRTNLDAVRATGVAGWAVIGAIWGASDVRAAIRCLR